MKEFDLDESLRGQRVCVSFQGVEQAMYLWCNGRFVGYAEDTFTPSEFDLTPYIQETGNRLCVEVYKRSSAAWIEDQDFFRFSGIFRSVYLYAKPKVHARDIWLKAELLSGNTTGQLTPVIKLDGETEGAKVHLRLTDREGYAPVSYTHLDVYKRQIFLIGGCDGAAPSRSYYTDFARMTPADTLILTLACGKYRLNDMDLGSIGGIPRILDCGQCNDAYSAIRIAMALAEAFGCGVNDLPLTLVLAWYEQDVYKRQPLRLP